MKTLLAVLSLAVALALTAPARACNYGAANLGFAPQRSFGFSYSAGSGCPSATLSAPAGYAPAEVGLAPPPVVLRSFDAPVVYRAPVLFNAGVGYAGYGVVRHRGFYGGGFARGVGRAVVGPRAGVVVRAPGVRVRVR